MLLPTFYRQFNLQRSPPARMSCVASCCTKCCIPAQFSRLQSRTLVIFHRVEDQTQYLPKLVLILNAVIAG